jgi:hypothetical protein
MRAQTSCEIFVFMEIDLFKVCPKLLGKFLFTQVDDEEADNTHDCLLPNL